MPRARPVAMIAPVLVPPMQSKNSTEAEVGIVPRLGEQLLEPHQDDERDQPADAAAVEGEQSIRPPRLGARFVSLAQWTPELPIADVGLFHRSILSSMFCAACPTKLATTIVERRQLGIPPIMKEVVGDVHSSATRPRSRLRRARTCFAARRRSRAAALGAVGRRRFGTTSAAASSSRSRSTTASRLRG